MKIPSDKPHHFHGRTDLQKGVSRELLAAAELTSPVAARMLRVSKLPKDFGGGYFKRAKVKRLPPAGPTHMAALKTFHAIGRKQDFKHHP